MEPVKSFPGNPNAGFLGQGSERAFRDQILEHVTNAIFALDRGGRFTLVNRAASDISGYSIEELIGQHFSMFFTREALPGVVTQFQRVILGGETVTQYEIEIVRKDGARRIVSLSGAPFRENGRITSAICLAEDVTERKRAEQTLRASEERFRATFEEAAVGMALADLQGRFLRVNRRFCAILGYAREELLQKTVLDITHPEDLDKNLIDHIRGTGHDAPFRPIEKRYLRRDGSVVWAELSGSMVRDVNDQPAYYIGVINDISERVQTRQELEFRNTILSTQQETSPDAILLVDENATIISFNRQFVEMWAIPEELVRARTDERVLQTAVTRVENPEAFIARVRYLYENRMEKSRDEIRTKDGKIIDRFSAPVIGSDGEYYGRVWYFRDITERKRAENALRDSRENLDRLLNSMAEGVYEVDIHGTCTFVNRAFLQILGYQSADEVLGQHIHALIHHSHPDGSPYPASECRMYRAYRTGEITNASDEVFWRKDGAAIPVEYWSRPIVTDGVVTGALATFFDITERRRTLEALRASEGRFRNLTESTSDWIWEVDANAVYSYVSPQVKNLLGYEPGEMLGKTPFDFMPADEVSRVRELYRSFAVQHKPFAALENKNLHKDGRLVVLETSAVPFFDAAGQFQGYRGIDRDITERKRLALSLAENERRLRTLVQTIPDLTWLKDVDGVYLSCNPVFERLFGVKEAEIVGKTDYDFVDKDLADSFREHDRKAMAAGKPSINEEWLTFADDGRRGLFETIKTPMFDENGTLVGVLGIARDITERKRQEALLAGEKRVLEMLARGAALPEALEALARIYEDQCEGRRLSAVLLLDADGTHLRVGGAPNLPASIRQRIDGVRVGSHGGFREGYAREMVAVSDIMSDPKCAAIRDEAMRYGLRTCWSTPIVSAKGALLGAFSIYTRESARPTPADRELLERACQLAGIAIEKSRDQESLATMAYYDVLTGLPNRVLLQDRLHQAMIEADRHERLVALLFMDLDRFKNINDTLGHEMGDVLLKKVAKRLTECVRPGDTVARPGGDEFIIVLAGVAHVDDVSRVAQKIIDAFSLPFEIAGRELYVTCSIGVTLYPFDDRDIETLHRNADVAMYHAKEEGRNNFQFYSAEMNAQSFQRLTLENALRRALERDELRLYYQPQVDLGSGRIVGAEALIRWQHPELGLVSPADFIPLAEETGLIVPIGEWVLRQVCAQARAWQEAGLPPVRVAVNLSARQFRQHGLYEVITAALQHAGLAPEWLEVELTESLVMHDVNRTIDVLRGLKKMGVLVAVDDFGTGYSSLSYLRRLPIDAIKIDRAFIEHIPDNSDDAAITTAIIALAQSLQLKTVAEGVETEAQADFLRRHGCDAMQGFYFSRPLPADKFAELLKDVAGGPRAG